MIELWTANAVPVQVLLDDDDPILPVVAEGALTAIKWHEEHYVRWLPANKKTGSIALARLMLGLEKSNRQTVEFRNGDWRDHRRANLAVKRADWCGGSWADTPAGDLATKQRVRAMMLASGPLTAAELDDWCAEVRR